MLKDLQDDEREAGDILSRLRLARAALNDLEADIETLDAERRDAQSRIPQLEWELARLRRDEQRFPQQHNGTGVDPAEHQRALEEIAALRREVELYRHDRSLVTEEPQSRWRLPGKR